MEGRLGRRVMDALTTNEEVKVINPEPQSSTYIDGKKGITYTSTTIDVVPGIATENPINLLPGFHYNVMPEDGVRPTEVRTFERTGKRSMDVVSVLVFPSSEAVPNRSNK